MSDEPIPTERWHKRRRKIRRDRGGRTRLPAPVPITTYHNEDNVGRDGNGGMDVTDDTLGDVPDTASEEKDIDHDDDELLEETIQDDPPRVPGQNIKDIRLKSNSGEDNLQPSRRSNRKAKPPSRFVDAVMVGLQGRRFLYNPLLECHNSITILTRDTWHRVGTGHDSVEFLVKAGSYEDRRVIFGRPLHG
jgi:hypothetical protein